MQFIFASDKDLGYGLLYTDGKQSEASAIRDKINIKEDDVDAYGFITFGVNSNQPLFFRVKKDTTYPRGAYFLHGVYHKGEPEYFAGEYENDLFSTFIDQEKLDEMRTSEVKSAPTPTVDSALLNESGNTVIKDSILKSILVKLYGEEKITLCISDDEYSNDYARCVLAKIFRYLTPSLRKACSYIIGASDNDGLMPDIRIRVLPERMVTKKHVGVIDMSGESGAGTDDSDIGPVVDRLTSFSDEERNDFFKWYEIVSNGYGSYYQQKKFIDFWSAYRGNAETSEKILNTYLRTCNDPNIENIPPFIRDAMASKYASADNIVSKVLTAPDVNDVIEPEKYLNDNLTEIKKLYLFCPNAQQYIANVMSEMVEKATISDAEFGTIGTVIKNGVNTKYPSETAEYPAYEKCYIGAVGEAAQMLGKRVEHYEHKKDTIYKQLDKFFNDYSTVIITKNDIIGIDSLINRQIKNDPDAEVLAKHLFDIIQHRIKEHDARCAELYGANVSQLDIDKPAQSTFHKVMMQLKGGNTFGVSDMLASLDSGAAHRYHELIDALTAKYGLALGENILDGGDPVFTQFMLSPGRIRCIATMMLRSDPSAAAYLLIMYSEPVMTFKEISSFVIQNRNVYARFSEDNAHSLGTKIRSAIRRHITESGIATEDLAYNAQILLPPITVDEANAGRNGEDSISMLLSAIESLWLDYTDPKRRAKKRTDKRSSDQRDDVRSARDTAAADNSAGYVGDRNYYGDGEKSGGSAIPIVIAICSIVVILAVAVVILISRGIVKIPGFGGKGQGDTDSQSYVDTSEKGSQKDESTNTDGAGTDSDVDVDDESDKANVTETEGLPETVGSTDTDQEADTSDVEDTEDTEDIKDTEEDIPDTDDSKDSKDTKDSKDSKDEKTTNTVSKDQDETTKSPDKSTSKETDDTTSDAETAKLNGSDSDSNDDDDGDGGKSANDKKTSGADDSEDTKDSAADSKAKDTANTADDKNSGATDESDQSDSAQTKSKK